MDTMKLKKNLVFLFFIIAGIIIGSLIASLSEGVPFLSWLAYGKTVGISAASPMVLDLSVVRVAFGREMGINVAQIFPITAALFAYKGANKRL